MKRKTGFLIAALWSACAHAGLGFLETPSEGGTTTGIGVISGWHCTSRNIGISIDGNPALAAGAGTPRGDTAQACGGNTDTGFSLLYNFNALEKGVHTIQASADGVAFWSVTFKVTNVGGEYLSGLEGSYHLRNFPAVNDVTVVDWNESLQNFSITRSYNQPPGGWYGDGGVAGTYFGAKGGHISCDLPSPTFRNPVHGTFTASIAASRLRVDFAYVDGSKCFLEGLARRDAEGFLVVDAPTGTCSPAGFPSSIKVDGLRLKAIVGSEGCDTIKVFGARPTYAD